IAGTRPGGEAPLRGQREMRSEIFTRLSAQVVDPRRERPEWLRFNGLYRTNRHGHFNVPMGRRAGRLPSSQELAVAASALHAADLQHCDALTALEKVQAGDSVYLDPPFPASRPNYGEYGYHNFSIDKWRVLLEEHMPRLVDIGAHVICSAPRALLRTDIRIPPSTGIISLDVAYQAGGNGTARRETGELLLCGGVVE
ncbi:MAG: DNA adenine methylase, partial [Actinomycetota bacterium]